MREYIEKIKCSQLFCRTWYRKLAIVSIFIMMIALSLIFFAIYQIINIPNPPYYATTSDGRVIQLDAKTEAMMNFDDIRRLYYEN